MKEAQLTNKPKSEISKQVNDNNKKRHRQNCAKLIIWPWPEKLCILYHEGRYIITHASMIYNLSVKSNIPKIGKVSPFTGKVTPFSFPSFI